MSHHCLKHFMAQACSMSHTNITTDTGSRKRAQTPNERLLMSCLHLAVSHKLSPQLMPIDSRLNTGGPCRCSISKGCHKQLHC